MQICFSDEAIEELRVIAEAEFGDPVTSEEARVMAYDLLAVFELLCRHQEQVHRAGRVK